MPAYDPQNPFWSEFFSKLLDAVSSPGRLFLLLRPHLSWLLIT